MGLMCHINYKKKRSGILRVFIFGTGALMQETFKNTFRAEIYLHRRLKKKSCAKTKHKFYIIFNVLIIFIVTMLDFYC